MKSLKNCHLLVLSTLLFSFWLSGCCRKSEIEEDTTLRTVILYMEARNNLYSDACKNIDSVLTHASAREIGSGHQLLIYFNGGTHRQPRLLKVVPGSSRRQGFAADTVLLKAYSADNTLTTEFMGEVLKDARNLSPSTEYGLILWSHSQGWIPKSTITRSSFLRNAPVGAFTKWFGYDNDGHSMNVTELREALELYDWEFILMDACFGASIEALYELRDCCTYWVGSPIEIMSKGFPYQSILSSLFGKDLPSSMFQICRAYMEQYNNDPEYPSAAVSVINMAEVDKLASCTADLIDVSLPERLQKPDFSTIQPLDNCLPALFYDFDGYMRSAIGYDRTDTLSTASREKVQALYEAFQRQLNKTVLFYDHTEFFYSYLSGFPRWIQFDRSTCGLSSYIPRTDYPSGSDIHSKSLKAYYKTSWAEAIGL